VATIISMFGVGVGVYVGAENLHHALPTARLIPTGTKVGEAGELR